MGLATWAKGLLQRAADEPEANGREVAAPPDKPTPEALLPKGAGYAGADASSQIWDSYLNQNPAEFIQQVSSTQSLSSALGFIYLMSDGLYDMLDEVFDKDTTIASTIEVLASSVLGREQVWEADEETPGATEIREAHETYLRDLESEWGFRQALNSLLVGAVLHGFSVVEVMWQLKDSMVVPRAYMHRHPGLFAFDADGALYYRDEAGAFAPAPAGKFIVFRLGSLYSNPYAISPVFNLRYKAKFKRDVEKAWVEYSEKYGSPLGVAKIASSATNWKQRAANMRNILRNLAREWGIVLSSDESIEFQARNGGQSGSPHKDLIEYFNAEQMRRLIGSTLSMAESRYGNRAMGEVHQQTASRRSAPLALGLAESIQRGLCRPFRILNWGENAPATRFKIDIDEGQDVKLALEIVRLTAELGMEISIEQVREWFGLRAPREGEDILRPPPKAPTAPPGPRIVTDEELAAFAEAEQKKKKRPPAAPRRDREEARGCC
jgi:phage gp29-like protein